MKEKVKVKKHNDIKKGHCLISGQKNENMEMKKRKKRRFLTDSDDVGKKNKLKQRMEEAFGLSLS